MKKKRLKIVPTFILVLLAFGLTSFVSTAQDSTFLVIVDPGHGGEDSGVEGVEKGITLNIAKKLKALNQRKDIQIILLRKSDESISLQDRVSFANKKNADLLLSIHCNFSKDKSAHGAVLYYSKDNKFFKKSKTYCQILEAKLNRGTSKDNTIKSAGLITLKNVNTPSITVAVGYLSNPKEKSQLQKDAIQEIMAQSMYEGIVEMSRK